MRVETIKSVRCFLCVMATATALAPLFVSASAQTIRLLQIEDAVSARDFLIQGHLAVIGPTSSQTRYWTAGDDLSIGVSQRSIRFMSK